MFRASSQLEVSHLVRQLWQHKFKSNTLAPKCFTCTDYKRLLLWSATGTMETQIVDQLVSLPTQKSMKMWSPKTAGFGEGPAYMGTWREAFQKSCLRSCVKRGVVVSCGFTSMKIWREIFEKCHPKRRAPHNEASEKFFSPKMHTLQRHTNGCFEKVKVGR